MARNAVLWVAAGILSFTACNYTDGPGGGPIVPGREGYGDASPPSATDLRASNSGSCSDGPATVTAGTYAYCSGQCGSKCPAGGVNGFSPSVFKFTTTIPDDGTDKGGGWQEATGTLNFYRFTSWRPEEWNCTFTVGMPLRTALAGTISATYAATVTADVATKSAANTAKLKPDLPSGIFCYTMKVEMRSIFANFYVFLGASVK